MRIFLVEGRAVDNPELNIAILPKGVCAIIEDDGEMSIFVPTLGAITKVSDKHINPNFILANWENRVVYIDNGEVWSIRTK